MQKKLLIQQSKLSTFAQDGSMLKAVYYSVHFSVQMIKITDVHFIRMGANSSLCSHVSQQSKTFHAMALCIKVGAPFNNFGAIKTLAKMEAALRCALFLFEVLPIVFLWLQSNQS